MKVQLVFRVIAIWTDNNESDSTDAGIRKCYDSPPKKLCKRVRSSLSEKETQEVWPILCNEDKTR